MSIRPEMHEALRLCEISKFMFEFRRALLICISGHKTSSYYNSYPKIELLPVSLLFSKFWRHH